MAKRVPTQCQIDAVIFRQTSNGKDIKILINQKMMNVNEPGE